MFFDTYPWWMNASDKIYDGAKVCAYFLTYGTFSLLRGAWKGIKQSWSDAA